VLHLTAAELRRPYEEEASTATAVQPNNQVAGETQPMVAKLPHMLVRKAGDYLGDGRELPLENVTPELDARLRKFDGEWISQVRQFHDPTLDF
jgi:hypothetical protein